MLEIHNLHVATEEGKKILNGVNLRIGAGEVHAIMGPNGSGKSTLANVIAGREGYVVTEGSIAYDGRDLLEMEPDERACAGIFLAFQYPVEIPGVSNLYFLKAAVNAKRAYEGKGEMDAMEFYELLQNRMKSVKMHDSFLSMSASPAVRKSATKSCKWQCWNRVWRCWTKPTPAWTSTRCASSPKA